MWPKQNRSGRWPRTMGKETLLHSRWGHSGDSPAFWESSYLKSITGWCTSEAFSKDENFPCFAKYVHFPPKTSEFSGYLNLRGENVQVTTAKNQGVPRQGNYFTQRQLSTTNPHSISWVPGFFSFSLRPHHFITHLTSLLLVCKSSK